VVGIALLMKGGWLGVEGDVCVWCSRIVLGVFRWTGWT
jgi:hypothetical protein